MIILTGIARMGEGALDEAIAAFEKVITASRAEEGVLHYSFAIDALDPSVLHVTEKYVDRDALMAHGQSAHLAEFQKTVGSLDMSFEELIMFDADDGTKLM